MGRETPLPERQQGPDGPFLPFLFHPFDWLFLGVLNALRPLNVKFTVYTLLALGSTPLALALPGQG